jgi:hypothetical protein
MLRATILNAEVITYVEGELLSGEFTMTYNGIETEPLPYNVSEEALKYALEQLNEKFSPLEIVRTPQPDMLNAYIWTISFPIAAGDVGFIDLNIAGISGENHAFFLDLRACAGLKFVGTRRRRG